MSIQSNNNQARQELSEKFSIEFLNQLNESAIARKVYDSLLHGASPHAIIEQLVSQLNERQKEWISIPMVSIPVQTSLAESDLTPEEIEINKRMKERDNEGKEQALGEE